MSTTILQLTLALVVSYTSFSAPPCHGVVADDGTCIKAQDGLETLLLQVNSHHITDAEANEDKRAEKKAAEKEKETKAQEENEDEDMSEQLQNIRVGDRVIINNPASPSSSLNGKGGKVVAVFKGLIKVEVDGMGWRYLRTSFVKLAAPTTTTTAPTEHATVLSTEGSVRIEKDVGNPTSLKMCLGMYRSDFLLYGSNNDEKMKRRLITKMTGETEQTQYLVFFAPCQQDSGRALIKTTGEDDPHIRWVKQPGGFYKNVQYGMCLRKPETDGRAFSDKYWKGRYLAIGTTDCDSQRAGPYIEDTGYLKLFCDGNKEEGHGLEQSTCKCAFWEPHFMFAFSGNGMAKYKPYAMGGFCAHPKPIKAKELP